MMANEIIYTAMLNDTLRLEQQFTNQNEKVLKWQTILYNTKKKESLILDEMQGFRPPVPGDRPEKRGHYLKICGAALYGHTLYTVYQNYGFISLKYYCFSNAKTFTRVELPISRTVITSIWGPLAGYAAFEKINDDIFFFLSVTHAVEPNLFRFSPETKQISKIVFPFNDPAQLKVISTSVNLFATTDLNNSKRLIQDDLRPMVREANFVENILSFTYLGYIEDNNEFQRRNARSSSTIYFFTEFDKKIQITRYVTYDKAWLLSGFHEELLKYDKYKTRRLE